MSIDIDLCKAHIKKLSNNIHSVLKGHESAVELTILCIMSGGHLLIEDVPGVGKTTLARAIAHSTGLEYRRIQFTSDILPSDILGVSIYNPQTSTFEFHEGPIFTNILLADEINRAEPRAQSALLEAMFEHQVSIDGITHSLPSPFIVIATQNPIDLSGTFALPDSQLDRFLFRIHMGYPDTDAEFAILKSNSKKDDIQPILNRSEIENLMSCVNDVYASDEILKEIQRITHATRQHSQIQQGISTRAMIELLRAARARALYHERDFVLPDDITALLVPALSHRIRLTPNSDSEPEEIIQSLVKA